MFVWASLTFTHSNTRSEKTGRHICPRGLSRVMFNKVSKTLKARSFPVRRSTWGRGGLDGYRFPRTQQRFPQLIQCSRGRSLGRRRGARLLRGHRCPPHTPQRPCAILRPRVESLRGPSLFPENSRILEDLRIFWLERPCKVPQMDLLVLSRLPFSSACIS